MYLDTVFLDYNLTGANGLACRNMQEYAAQAIPI